MLSNLLLAIDQGTTGTTSLVMTANGQTIGRATCEFAQHFPAPGLVEHDPDEIWQSVADSIRNALLSASVSGSAIRAIGITNQRETTVVWERSSGRPIHPAIVWQDRRTAAHCAQLRDQGHEPTVRQRTGLVLDPYFSGTKLAWLLDHVPNARSRAEQGELAFGTIDSFLVFRLGGATKSSSPVHATDVTNASRTLLMSLEQLDWDDTMLSLLNIPRSMLPSIVGCAQPIAVTHQVPHLPDGIVIAGIAGDQQAALFGQACFATGEAKCTYGTGAFVLTNIGNRPVQSRFGLLTSVGWKIGNEITYVLEGSAFVAGAAVQWLRDGLGLIKTAPEIETLARQVSSSEGVTFVPALSGLGAPYWDPDARGLICGLTRGTSAAHIARATLEAIAQQVTDLLNAMADDLGKPLAKMRVDGGAAANDLLLQLQADFANIVIERPTDLETTARGAAMLAGIGANIFQTKTDASQLSQVARTFSVNMSQHDRTLHRKQWADAVARARSNSP